jgi:hypothetical protein
VVIDEDLLLTAVVRVIKADKPAHAVNVRVELGETADDGGVMDVADDLEELESLGKLKRAPGIEWNDSGPTPKTRIRYVLPSKQ